MTMMTDRNPNRRNAMFADFSRTFDRMFAETARPTRTRLAGPAVSVYESDEAYALMADLPGFAETDLKVTVKDNLLTLEATRTPTVPEGFEARRTERGTMTLNRAFELPANVDATKAEAKMNNGVLTVTLPKRGEAQPRQIPVTVTR